MKKLMMSLVSSLLCISIAKADLGIVDTTSESNAKTGASNIGITQIYDHPGQSPNGTYYVPVEYNRTNAEGNGTEHDPNYSGKSDIDYIPLNQLKGADGATGLQGEKGDQGIKGDTGLTGSVGEKGDRGEQGLEGINGIQGEQGVAGMNGAQGDKGDKGDKGAVDQAVLDTINNSITNETNTRITNDTNIQNNINTTNKRIDNVDSRVSELEKTKAILDFSVRLADGKHAAVYFFSAYNWTQRHNDSFGIRYVLKLGQSYEETLIEKQEKELAELRRLLLTK